MGHHRTKGRIPTNFRLIATTSLCRFLSFTSPSMIAYVVTNDNLGLDDVLARVHQKQY